jgi:hypothetical protein
MKYKCNFINEDLGNWIEIDHYSPRDAAEQFAELAWTKYDQYKNGTGIWEGDHTVQIIDEKNKKYLFTINVAFEPHFKAYQK